MHIFKRPSLSSTSPPLPSFAKLMWKLGETFVVRDVMVQLPDVEYVAPGDKSAADRIVADKRYSVVPVSEDGAHFRAVFCAEHEPNSARIITKAHETSISDHIPDSTPLAESFFLFEMREWYLTLRENRVSGLITYWAFNSREFRVQLYAGLSRVEELSRDVLVKDGCGASSDKGLHLTGEVLDKLRKRFSAVAKEMGGHRFVDELDFYHVSEALKKHSPWREFLHERLGDKISNTEYDRRFCFTRLRDAVMHGRIVFSTYQDFKKKSSSVVNIGELIEHLDAYLAYLASRLPTG